MACCRFCLLLIMLLVWHFAQLNAPIMSSLPPHNVLMATRTCNNCGCKDVKQQTVIGGKNGNKG